MAWTGKNLPLTLPIPLLITTISRVSSRQETMHYQMPRVTARTACPVYTCTAGRYNAKSTALAATATSVSSGRTGDSLYGVSDPSRGPHKLARANTKSLVARGKMNPVKVR
jgi:hypothetical protein